MQLKKLELFTRFRGLQAGFAVDFSRPSTTVSTIEPLCFVGLNGSGKSNLMQVLAEIFNYLELYLLPESQKYFDKLKPFGFCIDYKTPVTARNFIERVDESASLSRLTWRHITVTKKDKEEPVFEYWYDASDKVIAPREIISRLLPNQVFGYSSGMNELISTPFIKMDFYYLEMMRRKMKEYDSPAELEDIAPVSRNSGSVDQFTVNRLFYLDYSSNAMVILANFLAEHKEKEKKSELDIINDVVGIKDLVSFRIAINFVIRNEMSILQLLQKKGTGSPDSVKVYNDLVKEVEIPPSVNTDIYNLMDCATTINTIYRQDTSADNDKSKLRLEMYFKVDGEMKRAFRDKFRGDATQLFRRFYLLNQLNVDTYAEEIQQQIKSKSRETNIKAILTKVADEDKVFHIDSMRLKKKNGSTVYYAQLSDGEHQYIQVAGALKLMDENGSLFLMDEPETHLNPEWRSTLFSTLNNILKTRVENDPDSFIPQQEIIVTSHSPFIVSDCQSHQVFIFQRDAETGNVKEPWHPKINTYGTSVDLLMDEVFSKSDTISGLSLSDIEEIKKRDLGSLADIQQAKEDSRKLGESVEKVFLFNYLIEKEKELKANANRL